MAGSSVIWNVEDGTGNKIPTTLIPGSLIVAADPFTEVSVSGLTAPEKNTEPDTTVTVDPSVLTSEVKWYVGSEAFTGEKFAPSTAYTAEIALTAGAGYSFGDIASVEGFEIKSCTEDTLVLTKTFPATADKDTPTYTVPTDLTATYGQTLNDVDLPAPGAGETPGTWTWADPLVSVGDVGNRTFTAIFTPTDTDTYKTVEVTVTIAVSAADIKPAPTVSIENWAFNETPKEPSVSNNPSDGDVTYSYKVKGADDSTYSSTVPTAVGEYTVKAEIAAAGNYKAATVTADFEITKANITPVVSIEGWTYGEDAKTPTVTGNPGNGAVSCTYSVKGANSFSDAVPTAAGEYTVKAVVAETDNYNGGEDTADFTIDPKNITGAVITLGTAPTYDGTEQSISITSVALGGAPLTTDDYTIKSGDKATNVGNTTLTIEGTVNYTGTASVDWSLQAKEITVGDFTFDQIDKSYTGDEIKPDVTSTTLIKGTDFEVSYTNNIYVGQATIIVTGKGNYTGTIPGQIFNITSVDQAPTITETTSVTKGGNTVDLKPLVSNVKGEVSFEISGDANGCSIADGVLTSGDNSGSVKVTVKITAKNVDGQGDDEYNAYTKADAITVTITDKNTQEDFGFEAESKTATYGDEPFTVAATGAVEGSTVTYSSSNPEVASVDPATGEVTIHKASADPVTITATASETKTYASASDSYTLTVSPKSVTVTAGDYKVSKVYDGTTDAGTGTGSLVDDIPDGAYAEVDVIIPDYDNANVGGQDEITVTLSLSGNGAANFQLASDTVTVPCEITKKDISFTATVADKQYDGTTTATVSDVSFTGLVNGEILAQGTDYTASAIFANANAGTDKDVTVSVALANTAKANNYNLTNATYATQATIRKAPQQTLADIVDSFKYTVTSGTKAIGVAGMPADAGVLVYVKGTAATTGSVTVSSWDVDASGNVTYALANGAATDTIELPITIQSTNYADSTVKVKFTLTEKDGQEALTITSGTTVEYGKTLELSVSGGSGTGAVTYDVTNDNGAATIEGNILTATKAGTITVVATKAGDDDYNEAHSVPVTITITKVKVPVPTAATGLVYNGEAQTGVVDGDHYSVAGNTATNAGAYTATVTLDDAANYEWATECTGSIAWSIAKAIPTGEPAFTKVTSSGKTLADAALTTEGGTFSVPGTVAWTSPNTNETEVKADTDYGWTFTPEDTTNYEILTGEIRVWRRSSGGGGGSSAPVAPVEPETCDGGKNCPSKPYTDVNTALWYHEAVDYALTKGFMVGLSDTTFGPEIPVSRAMVVTVLWSLEGKPTAPASTFEDLADGAWYVKAVDWASSKGIVAGYSAESFGPDDLITREQMATILRAYAKFKGQDVSKANDLSAYTDADQIADWAEASVAWANAEGLMAGRSATELAPKGTTKRAELAAMLMSFLEK